MADDPREDVFGRLVRRSTQRVSAVEASCPSADVLAAFVEYDLTDDERESVVAHLAECARCQSVVASVARTSSDLVTGDDRAERASAEIVAFPAPRAARMWRWVAPVAAATAAVLAWVAVRPHSFGRATRPVAETTTAQVAPTAEPSIARQPPAVASAPRSPAAEQPAERRNQALAEVQASNPPTRLETPSAGSVPSAPLPPSRPTLGAALETAAPSPTVADVTASAEKTTDASAATRRAGAGASAVAEPRWRSVAGRFEWTRDGQTWQVTALPTADEVRGAVSPEPDVWWLVDASGAVFFVERGAVTPMGAPAAGPAQGIESDGRGHARIRDAGGRVYETRDGGRTWRAVEGR